MERVANMKHNEIVTWRREENERCLVKLWGVADCARRRCVGDDVHLRGLIEFSTRCVSRARTRATGPSNRPRSAIARLYEEFLGEPLGERSHHLLPTLCTPRSRV